MLSDTKQQKVKLCNVMLRYTMLCYVKSIVSDIMLL